MIYLFIIFLSLFGAIILKRNNISKFIYILLCCLNILVFGLRYKVGGDTIGYVEAYKIVEPLGSNINFIYVDPSAGPIFIYIMSLFKYFTYDFTYWQFFHSFFINICIFFFCWKYSKNPFLSIFFFFLIVGIFFNTEILKESLAVSVFLINYINILKKRWIIFLIINLISVGFHYGALILFFVPFISKLKFDRSFIKKSIILVVLTIIGLKLLFTNFSYMPLITRASDYQDITDRLSVGYYILTFFKYVFVPFLCLKINNKKHLKINLNIESMVCVYLIIGILSLFYPGLFERFNNYFVMFFIVYLANTICLIYKNNIKTTFLLWILILSPYLFQYSTPITKRWLPYYSIFNQQEYIERDI